MLGILSAGNRCFKDITPLKWLVGEINMYNETNICMEFVSLMSRLTKLFYRYAVKFRTEILVMEDIFQLGE